MSKIRVAVVCGGPSAEYAVSVKTAGQVIKNLDRGKYAPRLVKIGKTGKWPAVHSLKSDEWPAVYSSKSGKRPVSLKFLKKNFNVVFIAMHGEYGEDGTLQKKLEAAGIKYTGSGSAASRLGMDKVRSAAVFRRAGLIVPRHILWKAGASIPFDFPAVVKPADRGSSVGTGVARNQKELAEKIKKAQKFSRNVLVQEYVRGREFTCGVLEINGRPRALLPTEIIPKTSGFFDYFAKYTKGASREITPPPNLSKTKITELRKIALRAHKAIGCRGFSRTDMILGPDNRFYVLEINTIPGLTETSLFPKAAKAGGISFKNLLDLIIRAA